MSRFGTFLLGASEFFFRISAGARNVACVGDPATHPGAIATSGQDGTLKAAGDVVAVQGATFACTIPGHGTTVINSVIKKTFHNGKLIVTEGAVAICGAKMNPPDRKFACG